MDELEYLRRRERQERAAAKNAASFTARVAHQELAQLFAGRIGEAAPAERAPRLHAA